MTSFMVCVFALAQRCEKQKRQGAGHMPFTNGMHDPDNSAIISAGHRLVPG
jgi:hypothetical protein